MVDAKLAETEARIAELTALADQLRSTARVLDTAPLDGPCDDSCGCVRGPVGAATISLTPKGAKC